jgi:hypothetical protein
MLPVATHANLPSMPAAAPLHGQGVAGLGRIITTATTAISGVRWIVFA